MALLFFYESYWGPDVGFCGESFTASAILVLALSADVGVAIRFFYRSAVMNINVVNVRNAYNETVVHNVTVNRVSYDGRLAARSIPQNCRRSSVPLPTLRQK
jgi:hypothetical protein